MAELLIDCPRCGSQSSETFYGPCIQCREELNATVGGHAHGGPRPAPMEYTPKMNVTPNAVALRDD